MKAILVLCFLVGIVQTARLPKGDSSKRAELQSHKKPCTSAEAAKTQCLNGGECFAIEVGGGRICACYCKEGYTGRRCQFRAIDPSILAGGRSRQLQSAVSN
ncbi:transcriptional repressor [Desmophyllum pertusum]|uniref:Transcriptional repressor n=1 Tax=Desmophyllum pertusum TaxID=174260 RepID=A0A9X0CES0_9CNID|nr:transcriptional repressor [Desmophyllum pertusum]